MRNEFVVLEVWTKYEGNPEGRWLDYSRCTAPEAIRFFGMATVRAQSDKYRAKHWISGEMLTSEQLAAMCETPEKWESKPPKV